MSRVFLQNIIEEFGSEEGIINSRNNRIIKDYFLAKNSTLASYSDHPLADWHKLTYFCEHYCSQSNADFAHIENTDLISMEHEISFKMNSHTFINDNIFEEYKADINFTSITQAFAYFKASFFFDWERAKKILEGQFPSIESFEMSLSNFENHVWDFNKINILETIVKKVIQEAPRFKKDLKKTNACFVYNSRNEFWGIGDSLGYSSRNIKDRNNYYGKLLLYLRENVT